MTSASLASFMKIAWPSGLLRLSVSDCLLRWRFWKSNPWRAPPIASVLLPGSAGCSILITSAPQSASCRTAVGPARCAVRSRTLIWESGSVVIVVVSSFAGGASLQWRVMLGPAGRTHHFGEFTFAEVVHLQRYLP